MFRVISVILLLIATVKCQNLTELCNTNSGEVGFYFVRNPANCSEFFSCVNTFPPIKLSCGKGTVFSQAHQVCVFKNSYYDDCEKQISPGKYNDPRCEIETGLNKDPTDCNRFIPCYNGTSYLSMPCQKNLHFNVAEQRCMEAEKSDCE